MPSMPCGLVCLALLLTPLAASSDSCTTEGPDEAALLQTGKSRSAKDDNQPDLDRTDYTQWVDQSNDISGLRKAELQLQGQTADPGAECFEADFEQYNKPGVQSYGVKGEWTGQGLIFSWLDGDLRKMVLTDLQGNVQETGYVNRGFGPYMITNTWTERPTSRGYTITNFRTCGDKGTGEPCGHSYECKHGLVCAIFAEEGHVSYECKPGPYGTTEDSHD